eukprot:1177234-Prorocentrum_minimum.AAC.4
MPITSTPVLITSTLMPVTSTSSDAPRIGGGHAREQRVAEVQHVDAVRVPLLAPPHRPGGGGFAPLKQK